jgi:hypothetical protein
LLWKMSVREKLVADLLNLGLDGHEIFTIITSQFHESQSNGDRVRVARDILTTSGVSAPQLTKLTPLLTRFVLEFVTRKAPEEEPVVDMPVEEVKVDNNQNVRRKKPQKLSPKDLQKLFDLRGRTTIQQYSDDEGGPPKPIIVNVNKPLKIVKPAQRTLAPVNIVPASPSVWSEVKTTEPIRRITPIDDGGFW